MIARVKKWLRVQDFHPTFWGMFVNPFYIARKALYEAIASSGKFITGKTLDIGCGRKPYQQLFRSTDYIGVDVEQSGHTHQHEEIDVIYDGKHLPFSAKKFDSVICSQVLEHVFEPSGFVQEIYRVLKPGGYLLLTTPFIWDEHEQPYDYGRYSSFGLKYLLEKNHFHIVKQHKLVNNFSLFAQLLNAFIYKKVVSSNQLLNMMWFAIVMGPITLAGVVLSKLLPRNNDLYLDNFILAKKK